MGRVFFSQNLEELARHLAHALASEPQRLLQKRWILVPDGEIKQWLSVRLGAGVGLAGCKISSLEEALGPEDSQIPTALELTALIFHEVGKEDLAQHLGELFALYGLHSTAVLDEADWQGDLLRKIFVEGPSRMPAQCLPAQAQIIQTPVHCFGFDFLPEIYWKSLLQLPRLHLYLFSPCLHFWGDLATDWEKRRLSSQAREQIDPFVRDAPPLLANWGKLGRKTLQILDAFPLESVDAHTPIPETSSLLHNVQRELLSFEKQDRPLDDSIQIFLTGSSKMNEVSVLCDEILRLANVHQIPFSEMAVFTPDIQRYAPLIEYLFAGQIPYRIAGVEVSHQSSKMAALIEEEWSVKSVVQWLQTPSVYRKARWKREEVEQLAVWVKQMFRSSDWKEGAAQMVRSAATLCPGPEQSDLSFEDLDLFEELLAHLLMLEEDLAPLKSQSLRLGVWADRLEGLVDKYLALEEAGEEEARSCFMQWRKADVRVGDKGVPFSFVAPWLLRPKKGSIHGTHLHAVYVGPIETGSIVPARACFLIGMDEEAFPRNSKSTSLNLLKKQPVYVPERCDVDRYLFLQILFAARDCLRISYGHLSPDEGKPIGPSPLIEELMPHPLFSQLSCVRIQKDPAVEQTPHFSLRCPEPPPFKEQREVSLSDLVSFARHPWRYHLQKIEGIFLPPAQEKPWALQRSLLLRASLKWPLKDFLKDQLPTSSGPFCEAFQIDVEEKAPLWEKWRGSLTTLSLQERVAEKRILPSRVEHPPLEVLLPDGSCVRITGEIPVASLSGPVHLGDDTLASVLKSWPEILIASLVLGTSQLIFLKQEKQKTLLDPLGALVSFLVYFFRAQEALSPLIPDWARVLLLSSGDSLPLPEDDPLFSWLYMRLEKPDPKDLLQEWGWLKDSFSHLTALYGRR